MNRAIADALESTGRIAPIGENWRGRPVLVTRNDPALALFNGDVGLIAPDANMDGRLRAFFAGPDGLPRAVAPPRLPPHETVFGMSIHKSQGSEFDAVTVLLPLPGSSLLSRELLYTAVTRARRQVLIFASEEAVTLAIGQRVERASGLRERLWGDRVS
jgi:exodeoxyribonuclease V alpha subunit